MTDKIYVLLSFVMMALATFFTRAFPFLFLKRFEHNKHLRFIGKNLPPAVMLLLVAYCVKDTPLTPFNHMFNQLFSISIVAGLHLWRRNGLLSISVGTLVYVMLERL